MSPALRALRRALSLIAGRGGGRIPLAGRVRLARAYWRLRRGDPWSALEAAERLGARHPAAAAPTALAALALLRLGRSREAIDAAREAAALAPGSAGIARISGSIALAAGDHELAAERLAVAATASPSDAWTLMRLGDALLRLKRPDDALEVIEKAISIKPGARLLAMKGSALSDLGRHEDAVSCLDGALTLGMRSARTVETLATALTDLGRGDEAIRVVRKHISADERDRTLARVCLRLRRFEDALRHANDAIERAPDDPWNHQVRAAALRGMGDLAAALASIAEARRLGDDRRLVDHERSLQAAVARTQAQDHLRAGRHEDALRSVDEALQWDPENPRTLAARARVLQSIGDFEGALLSIARARARGDTAEFEHLERRVRGWIRALSAGWLPRIDGEPSKFDPLPNRILHLLDRSLPHIVTGYTQRSEYIVQSQRETGLDPVVVTRLGYPEIIGVEGFSAVEVVDGIAHHRLTVEGVDDYEHLPRDVYLEYYAAEAAKVVERVRPAILHASASYLNGLVALALKQRYGLPMVYEVRAFYEDLWGSRRGDPVASEAYEGRARAETLCMTGADRIVTLAEVMKAEIVGRGIDPARVVVVPNAVDVDRFAPRPRDRRLADSLGLGDRIVLGYVTNLRHWESVGTLIRAIAILRNRGFPVAGLVVGDGPELDPLLRLRHELGLASDVVLTGAVPHDEVPRYCSLMDVFVVSRRKLRLCELVTPLKPYEAMAMGLPLLASDLAALREVVGPGERGMTFAAEDPEDLAARAEPLVSRPDLRRRLGDAGREWVCRERTWRRNAEIYRTLYTELLDRRAPARA